MKFGAQLDASLFDDWRFYYIDYEGLKRLIKPKRETGFIEEDEARFVEFLEKDLDKVASFQKIKLGELNRRIQHCEMVAKSAQNESASLAAQEQINSVTAEVTELAKFSRLNYTGFLKIIKKHDKLTGYVLKPMFMVRLNSKPFFKENFDALLVRLSKLYALVRQDDPANSTMATPSHQARTCRTVKYWVHPDNVMELKLYILKHLPVLLYSSQASGSGTVDPRISSVYLDSEDFGLYSQRVEKKDDSPTFCLTWFGSEDQTEVFVEKKSHRGDYNGETHSKQQFKIKAKYVDGFLKGEPVMNKTLFKMRLTNDHAEVDKIEHLAEDVQNFITSRELRPILRTFYNRTAFQMPGEAQVRITLDTEVAMIREDNFDAQRSGESWRRRDVGSKYPFASLPPGDITRFPFAVLEIKLESADDIPPPAWVDQLIHSRLVEPVPNFSKFIHGVATLLENRVGVLPFWLPQLDKDIRRAPAPAFLFASETALARQASSQSHSQSHPNSKKHDVRIDVKPAIPTFNERTPLLNKTKSQPPTAQSSRFFSSLFGGSASSSAETIVNPITQSRLKRISVPIRVEPKVFFANERTFLSWLNFALVLGGLALSLLNFGDAVGQIAGILFTTIALAVMIYALFVFQWRAEKIRNREPGPYDDRTGPIILVSVITVATLINFWLKFSSLAGFN